jgi:D-alanyl-D-alanine carboxypeptidase/D-alanyl-D-alanine-endopeptidase (penicillin-binding protein 4)
VRRLLLQSNAAVYARLPNPAFRLLAALLLLQGTPAAHAAPSALPAPALAALQRAKVPAEAMSVLVQEAGGPRTLLAHQNRELRNPASLIKLLTTYAALDQLGPAWSWSTPVYVQGAVQDGVLDGNVVLRGSGDPKLVLEQLWLLLRRLQALGVREVRGDFVLDRSAFAPMDGAAGDFDGDATRPYNVRADALMINFKAVVYTFVPDPARGVARVLAEPELGAAAGAAAAGTPTVPLAPGPCEDWRAGLKPVATEAGYRFTGRYPAACGELVWALADPDPARYGARLLQAMWREMGGRLGGTVREGTVPEGLKPLFEHRSEPLAQLVRDINKHSSNVMSQQLFLSLPLQREPGTAATPDAAREWMRRWATERLGELPEGFVLDNGSGLSRTTRVTARWLARLLQHAWASPVMPELMGSLPVSGTDGTLRRSRASAGRAHLKTGSLRDAAGVAGYVLSDSGRRYVVVALIHHPNAPAARAALDAIVQWAIRDGGETDGALGAPVR